MRPRAWKAFSAILCGLAIVVIVVCHPSPAQFGSVIMLALGSLLLNLLPIKWKTSSVNLGPGVEVATVWLLGVGAGVLVIALGRLGSLLLQRPTSRGTLTTALWSEGVNAAVASMSSVVLWYVYAFSRVAHPGSRIAPLFLSAVAGWLAGVTLSAVGSSIRYGSNVFRQWVAEWVDDAIRFPVQFVAALAVYWTYGTLRVGWWGLFVFGLFLLLVAYSARLYVGMTEIYWSTVESLMPAIEAKTPLAVGHSKRVAALAVAMGRKLCLGGEEIRRLYFGAMLHDVGLAAVDEPILNSPEPLTVEQFCAMARHPVIGADIMSKSGFLGGSRDIILHHHERFDGSGYPSGLKGRAIPLGARIVSMADAFDAMTNPPPYSRTLSEGEALVEIERFAGTQFDPGLVRLLVEVVRERARWGERVFQFNYSVDLDR